MAFPATWVKQKDQCILVNEFLNKDESPDSVRFHIVDTVGKWKKENWTGDITYMTHPLKKPELIRYMIFTMKKRQGQLVIKEGNATAFDFEFIHYSLVQLEKKRASR